ncbi:MAG: glutathione S-transferase C-terminal domain-containing protein [Devosia sp.]
MPRLHDYVLSADCYAARLMFALAGVGYESVAVDVYPGGAIAPVLEDGDTVLSEPGAILTHIAGTCDAAGTWLPVTGASEIAEWLAFAGSDLRALAEARLVAVLGAKGDLVALNGRGRAALRIIEDHLTDRRIAGNEWFVGDGPSVADIALFPHVMLSHDSGIGHEDYPAINLWQRRLRKLKGFAGMPGIPDFF